MNSFYYIFSTQENHKIKNKAEMKKKGNKMKQHEINFIKEGDRMKRARHGAWDEVRHSYPDPIGLIPYMNIKQDG